METTVQKKLFWFLKEGTKLDLSNKTHVDMYIQQILSRGKSSDVKKLLKKIKPLEFSESFARIKNFLPKEIKMFWEEGLEILTNLQKRIPPSLANYLTSSKSSG